MSSGESTSSQQPRKPPLADWPSIKILTPPRGRFSPKTDEWCLTYCSQTVNGRYHSKEPYCRSVCIRRVFPHEIKNIISFKTHKNVGPDGKAMYPLPSEGQPVNLPRILGGKPPINSEAEEEEEPSLKKPSAETARHWDEGWYLWTSPNRLAIHDKVDSMMMNLEYQQQMDKRYQQQREIWQEYHDHIQKMSGQPDSEEAHKIAEASKWWGHIVPPRPLPEFRSQSLLVPLPLDASPFWDRISNVLAPSHKALEIFRDSLKSGEQVEFAGRVWEKAWTNEPFILASKTLTKAYERWKDREATDEDDSSKSST